MPTYTYLMFTNPVEGREDEFNRWYDDVHLPDIRRSGAFTTGQRFKVVDSGFAPAGEHGYAAIYEVDGDDAEAALGKLAAAFGAGEMEMSDAFDSGAGKAILLQRMDAGF